ncbi:hypothetical protein, partial [Spirillospora sp. NPDC048823]|uniref:hypothetical protein n=1 Tax=Spirillospora sp. NPDC048823 TaxID=3364525 RepID=UPI0037220CA0
MIEDILDSILSWFTEQILLAAMDSFQMQMSWWIGESYSQNFADRKGAGGVLYFLRVHTNWLTSLMAFAGFIFAAFRAAIQRKGEPFRAAFSQFFELAIIVLMLATVVQLASIAGDRYSSWILWEAAPKDSNWTKKWNEELGPHQQAGTIFLLAIFGVFLTISSLIQWGLMLFRSAAMVVLVGIIPVFAASRYTSYGERAYKMAMGYLISWWAYGPIAATGAAAGQRLMASDYQADRFAGMALIIGMVFALPAVFSAIMPAVREDNNSFSPRQVGHFLFGGTAVNVGKLNGVWSGATGYINKRLTPEGNPSGPRGNPSGPRGNPNGPNGNPNGPNGNPNGPNGNPNGPNGNPNGPRSNPNGPRGNPNVPNGTPPNGSKGHPPNGPSGTLSR